MGLRPTYINLRKGTKDSGLLIFYLDPTCHDGKIRIVISNLTVIDRSGIEEALLLSLNYIWTQTQADEVRLGLHDFKETDTVENTTKEFFDEDYKTILKKNGF